MLSPFYHQKKRERENEVLIHITVWINLENMTQSEGSQAYYHMISSM